MSTATSMSAVWTTLPFSRKLTTAIAMNSCTLWAINVCSLTALRLRNALSWAVCAVSQAPLCWASLTSARTPSQALSICTSYSANTPTLRSLSHVHASDLSSITMRSTHWTSMRNSSARYSVHIGYSCRSAVSPSLPENPLSSATVSSRSPLLRSLLAFLPASATTKANIPAKKPIPLRAMNSSRSMTAALSAKCTAICPARAFSPF